MGCGRPCWMLMSLISVNQLFAEGLASTRELKATLFRIFPSRRQIMLNRDSWRRCRCADIGRDPARKKTALSGVRSWSFMSLVRVFLW